MSKPVKVLAVVFAAWWAISAPVAAGHEVGRLGAFASHAAHSVATAISSI